MYWFLRALRKYAVFSGRASRTEYWMFVLFNVIFLITAILLDLLAGTIILTFPYGLFFGLFSVSMILPRIAIGVRRLHDMEENGWLIILFLIPPVGTIWLLVLFCTKGDVGENRYGPDPKEIVAEDRSRRSMMIPVLIMVLFLVSLNFLLYRSYFDKREALEVPVVHSTLVESVSQISAAGRGIIGAKEAGSVTAKGVCWSTSSNPTVADSKVSYVSPRFPAGRVLKILWSKLSRLFEGRHFKLNLIGLEPNTTYFARAFATNNVGTAYGDVVSFTTQPLGILTDIDGNVYRTVTMGTQEWMVENLRTTRYRNGDLIPNVADSASWSNLTSGACCIYNNDSVNGVAYGRLYNWYAVHDSTGISPEGWHVPTDDEWGVLLRYLSDNRYGYRVCSAESLRASSGWAGDTIQRRAGNVRRGQNGTNFSALPGGCRQGKFSDIGVAGYWWSSTENNPEGEYYLEGTYHSAFYRFITNNSDCVFSSSGAMKFGFSVRCVKDY